MIIPKLPPLLITLNLPLIHATNILGLALGPGNHPLRLALTLPLVALLACQGVHRTRNQVYGLRYALECFGLCAVGNYVDWVVLGRPDKEGWRKVRYGVSRGEKSAEEEVPQGFWARAWWGLRLVMGTRYVGWTQQVKGVRLEVDARYSRWLFILRKSLRVMIFHLVADLLTSYTAATPHGSFSDIAHVKPPVSFANRPFHVRFWFAWVHIFMWYAEVEKANAAYGVVSVATGLANPRDCPSMFGDLKDMYTLRKAWSSVWHQQVRRICSTPGIVLVRDVLHCRKGSFASKYLQLFIAFGLSGIMHSGGALSAHASILNDGSLAYFVGQAAIIMIEDHLVELGKNMGAKDSTLWRLIGFAWTVFVIGATSQRWVGVFVGYGMWIHERRSDWFGVGPKIAV